MDNKKVASELLKLAKALISASVRKGEYYKVDMSKVKKKFTGVPGQHQMKILRRVLKNSDGKVYVVEVRNKEAEVVGSPGEAILGGVWVPVDALKPA